MYIKHLFLAESFEINHHTSLLSTSACIFQEQNILI